MRLYKSTSSYPAYKHTSFNVVIGDDSRSATLQLSLHVKYRYVKGGFWFGLRLESDIHRQETKLRKEYEKLRQCSVEYTCAKCGIKQFGPAGLRRPEGWEFIYRMDFCDNCVSAFTYHDLLAIGE